MSDAATLYLVRLRYDFRYNADEGHRTGWRVGGVRAYERAFPNRAEAEAWARATPPIWANPFAAAGIYINAPGYNHDHNYNPLSEPTLEWALSESENVVVPDAITEFAPLGADADALPILSIPFLRDYLREIIGVEPPDESRSPEPPADVWAKEKWQWREWWRAEVAPNASPDQKAAIWRLLMPAPYEIVSVPLVR